MTGAQRLVMVVSILNIIGGALVIVLGAVTLYMASDSADEAAGAMLIAGLLIILMGLFMILGGFIGIRAAKNPTRSGLFYFLSLIALLLSIAGIISSFISAGFHIGTLCSIILPLIMFISARSIRAQGKAMKEQWRLDAEKAQAARDAQEAQAAQDELE